MPDDNRFAGLSEAVDEDDDGETASVGDSDADSSDENDAATAVEYESAEADSDPDSTTADDGSETESESERDDPTAFPFDATEKKTVYVRPETLDDLEDARALVDAQLRTDHDVRDLTGREFYDAVFRLAAADTDGLIEEILEAREE